MSFLYFIDLSNQSDFKIHFYHKSGFLMHHVSGMYSMYMKNLVSSFTDKQNVNLYEYQFNGQSYHAKGLWYNYLSDDKVPNLSILGSSNFNERARTRDLELNFLLMTKNKQLKYHLSEELNDILDNASLVKEDNKLKGLEYEVPLLCRFLKPFAKSYF